MTRLFCLTSALSGICVRFFFSLTLIFVFSFPGFAQIATALKGLIIDKSGRPIQGVLIVVKQGTSEPVKTISDNEGAFLVSAQAGSSLTFSSPGYYNYEKKVKGESELLITLQESYLHSADSIVLISGKKLSSDNISAVSTIYTNQLLTTPGTSYLKSLPGRLAGLYIQQNSGEPEGDLGTTLNLHGQNPLILIDGIPRSFSSLDPESIESVSVLKDALSTVLLGQRSSHGAILITTKKGTTVAPQLSFTAQRGVQNFLNLPKPVSAADYAMLYNEALKNDNREPIYSSAQIDAYRNGSDPTKYPNTDWQQVLLANRSVISRYNLNLENGGAAARYFVSLDYMKAGGIFNEASFNTYNTNSDVNRYSIRSNVNVDLSNSLNVAINLYGRIVNANEPGGTVSGLLNDMFFTPNNAYPQFNPNGSLGGNRSYADNLYGQSVYSGYLNHYSRDLSTDLELTQKLDNFLPGLWVKGNLSFTSGLNQQVNRTKTFAVHEMQISPIGDTTYQQFGTNGQQKNGFSIDSRMRSSYAKLSLGYDKQFGQSSMNLLVLADRQSITTDIDLPETYKNLAASASYHFNKKYSAEAAISYGGLNRYMPGKRFGLFYAGGVMWDVKQEEFLKNGADWINSLTVKATYGKTGYANVGYFVYNSYYSNQTGYVFGSSSTSFSGFSEVSTFANPNATWEKANKFNFEIDAAFKDHFQLTIGLFKDKHFDLMQRRGNSAQLIGRVYPQENIGINSYTGSDISLSYQNNFNALNFFVTANGSVLKSKIIEQDEEFRKYTWMQRTGAPVGQLFGYVAEGFFQSQDEINNSPKVTGYLPVPGDLKYKDLNNDRVIDQYDETQIGNTKPLIFFGTTIGFNLKGFDLSISLQGAVNRNIVLTGNDEWEFQNKGKYQAFQHHLDRWTPDNKGNASYPRLTIGENLNNHRLSSFWVRSGDYLRLQNISLGYDLPVKLLNHVGLDGLRLFVNGLNLATFSSQSQVDPEAYNAVYPLQRILNAGVNIKF